MVAVIEIFRVQKSVYQVDGGSRAVYQVDGGSRADHALAEAEDVGVVMLAGEASGEYVGAASGADALVLVCRDGHADARSADEDTQLTFARLDLLAEGVGVYGVVAAVCRVGAYVHDLMTEGGKVILNEGLEGEARVVAANNDFHSSTFLFLVFP